MHASGLYEFLCITHVLWYFFFLTKLESYYVRIDYKAELNYV